MYSFQSEKINEKICAYLKKDSSGHLYRNRDIDLPTMEKNYRIFKVEWFDDYVNNIIGLYDPSAMNILTGNVSGILFLKERFIYKETANSMPIAIEYEDIGHVVQKFNSLILELKKGGTRKLKGIMFSHDEIYHLFEEIIDILR